MMPADVMTASPPDKAVEKPPAKPRSDLQRAGGSQVAEWNNNILNAVLSTIWRPSETPPDVSKSGNVRPSPACWRSTLPMRSRP